MISLMSPDLKPPDPPDSPDLLSPLCLMTINASSLFDDHHLFPTTTTTSPIPPLLQFPDLSSLIFLPAYESGLLMESFVSSGDMFLALVPPITAECRMFTTLCMSFFGAFRAPSLLLCQQEVSMSDSPFYPVNRVWLDFYCPVFPSKEYAPLSDLSLVLSGCVARDIHLKTSNTLVSGVCKGSTQWRLIASVCVAVIMIVNCALVVDSILEVGH